MVDKTFVLRKIAALDAFEKMALFRNVVVHDCEKIDPEIVVGVLKNNLSDFVLFKESILQYLR